MNGQDDCVRRVPGAAFRRLGEQVIVAVPGRDDIDVLVGSAAAVWSLLDVPRTITELVDILESRFRSAPHQIERDVRVLLERLRAEGAVEVSDGCG